MLELCLAPLVVKEATVFINNNRANINGNIQYIIHAYIYTEYEYIAHSKVVFKSL